jgi:hypothetical protein
LTNFDLCGVSRSAVSAVADRRTSECEEFMLRTIILLIAAIIGGWLAYDGTRALVKGDYTTPGSGPQAGQLGPWSKVVSAVGLDPRGGLMKRFHIALGILWFISALLFLIQARVGWIALLTASICTLWYLPIGTVLAIAELCLLLLPSIRNLK